MANPKARRVPRVSKKCARKVSPCCEDQQHCGSCGASLAAHLRHCALLPILIIHYYRIILDSLVAAMATVQSALQCKDTHSLLSVTQTGDDDDDGGKGKGGKGSKGDDDSDSYSSKGKGKGSKGDDDDSSDTSKSSGDDDDSKSSGDDDDDDDGKYSVVARYTKKRRNGVVS